MKLPQLHQQCLERSRAHLVSKLRDNLHSLVLYGSAVRGDFEEASSDLNLLIILRASTGAAHRVIAEISKERVRIEPFIVELGGMPRAERVFALKFLSIQRDYELLYGEDVLRDLCISRELQVLLAEQELRNLRMRTVHAYVTNAERYVVYLRFVVSNHAQFFLALSDALRTVETPLPPNWNEWSTVFEKELGVDTSVLRRVEQLKTDSKRTSVAEVHILHADLITLLGQTLRWMEKQHPVLPI